MMATAQVGEHTAKCLVNWSVNTLPTCWQTHCQRVGRCVGRHTANMLADGLADTLPTCWQTHCQHVGKWVGRHIASMLAKGLADILPTRWQMGWQTHCQHVGKRVGIHIASMLACLQMVSRQTTNILTNGFTDTTKQLLGCAIRHMPTCW